MEEKIKIEFKICPYCRSDDIYKSGLRKGFNYRCNCCGEYLK